MLAAAGAVEMPKSYATVPQQPVRPSWAGQPEFHVVYWFEGSPVNDFIEGGVYTKADDAQAHIERRKGEGRNGCWAGIAIKLTHEQLCYSLAEKRLGAMAAHLDRLMRLPAAEAAGQDTDGLRILYGPNSQFPAAVAKP